MTRSAPLLACACALAACGPHYVEGTKIEDNPTNRSILAVVEAYRLAVEQKDVDVLAQLVSEQYFEGAGTTGTAEDDYGLKAVLTRVLPMLQENIKEVFYTITVERIELMGQSANVHLEYEIKFHYVEGDLDGWSTKKDKHRLDLVWEDESWKISGGL
ncbi:MAG: nuclear transport factor 2 family protein [Deltaproteobacteria bacterium]|nr:nuclear transport factor 2 family protein [Deltaproteobacteria bacterium]